MNQQIATVTVQPPTRPDLAHLGTLTGYRQTRTDATPYVEYRRSDNGLFNLVPASWVHENPPVIVIR